MDPFNPNKLLPVPIKPKMVDGISLTPEQKLPTPEPPKPNPEDENLVEKELSPEQIEKIMEKVKDIHEYGNCYISFSKNNLSFFDINIESKKEILKNKNQDYFYFNITGRNEKERDKHSDNQQYVPGGLTPYTYGPVSSSTHALIFNNPYLKEVIPQKNLDYHREIPPINENEYSINPEFRFDLYNKNVWDDVVGDNEPGTIEARTKIIDLKFHVLKKVEESLEKAKNELESFLHEESKITEEYRQLESIEEYRKRIKKKESIESTVQEWTSILNTVSSRGIGMSSSKPYGENFLKEIGFSKNEIVINAFTNWIGDTANYSDYGFYAHFFLEPKYFQGYIESIAPPNPNSIVSKNPYIFEHEGKEFTFVDFIKELYKKTGGENYLVPIYDYAGNLLWPKKMNYEEVKKFVEERDKKKEE